MLTKQAVLYSAVFLAAAMGCDNSTNTAGHGASASGGTAGPGGGAPGGSGGTAGISGTGGSASGSGLGGQAGVSGAGGTTSAGGATVSVSGGRAGSGGSASGGTSSSGSGGVDTGGASGTGGLSGTGRGGNGGRDGGAGTGGATGSGASGGVSGSTSGTGGTTGKGGATGGSAGAVGTGGAAGNGTVTGGASGMGGSSGSGGSTTSTGPCTAEAWNPPSNMTKDLTIVWDYMTKTYNPPPPNFKNFIWDQVIANKGSLNYCVRIDLETNPGSAKPSPITATQRDQIQKGLEAVANAWLETWMKGYDCWPYDHIPVKITGWAVGNKSSLGFTDTTPVYVGTMREGAPECSEDCGRFFHQDGNYSKCPGGADNHYDLSLWLTNGMGVGGAGGDWGQRVDYAMTLSQMGTGTGAAFIVEHEFGHGLGLPDFYSGGSQDFYTVEKDAGFTQTSFVMKAGSASQVTSFDGWMARQQWVKFVKDRYKF